MDLRSEAQLELLVVKSLRSLLWKQVASLRLEVEVVGGSARVGKGPQSLHLSAQEPRFPPPGRAPEGAGPHTHPCYKRLLSIHMRSINYVSSGIQTREAWVLPSGCGAFSLEQAFPGKIQEACRERELERSSPSLQRTLPMGLIQAQRQFTDGETDPAQAMKASWFAACHI